MRGGSRGQRDLSGAERVAIGLERWKLVGGRSQPQSPCRVGFLTRKSTQYLERSQSFIDGVLGRELAGSGRIHHSLLASNLRRQLLVYEANVVVVRLLAGR